MTSFPSPADSVDPRGTALMESIHGDKELRGRARNSYKRRKETVKDEEIAAVSLNCRMSFNGVI